MSDPYNRHWRGARLDPYRVFVLYGVRHPALQQAIKKALCAGQRRGGKDARQDVQEAIEALQRWLEMDDEDAGEAEDR